MLGYIGSQWWTVVARHRFESKRSRLELEALGKSIHLLNRKAEAAPEVSWNGYRKFTVARKVLECEDTYSFYLKPHNGKSLPSFKPGQYLTFEMHPPQATKPLVRCYSLSDGAINDDYYRVTIKRALPFSDDPNAPPGIISGYFSDNVKEGDILDVKAPSGRFFLDVEVGRPVVLISGGIGITPMLAMARVLTHIGDTREIYFFFGCRNSVDHMFRDEVLELQKTNPNMRLHICYSRPLAEDTEGEDYNHHSRVTIDLMKEILPSSNYEYYLCGPGPFMDTLVKGLYDWGVPKKDVKFEAFGPATVKSGPRKRPPSPTRATNPPSRSNSPALGRRCSGTALRKTSWTSRRLTGSPPSRAVAAPEAAARAWSPSSRAMWNTFWSRATAPRREAASAASAAPPGKW